jgi:ribonucleotide reductase beta subunit family protein with ferritin-like domain
MKTNHLLNETHIEFSEEPLFLGSGRNIARLELNIEQHIQKATDNAVGLMWFATDFSYIEDAKDYALMEPKLRELFLKNLKFQQMADSAAARSVAECFIPCTTNPQLESWW